MTPKKEKGFTLIELLAVIVILAVIALIATPIIMNVIYDAKKGSAKDSMYSYVKATELAATKEIMPDTDLLSGIYTIKDGNLVSGSTPVLTVDMKGTKPNNIGYIIMEKGQVLEGNLQFDEYCIEYKDGQASNKDGCITPSLVTYTEGDVIYYNPETNKKCSSSQVNTIANAKTGCLKWNVVTMGDTPNNAKIDIMLDHNTTWKVPWNSANTNTEMKEVATALQADITTWDSPIKKTARLISGQEVANIGKDSLWASNVFTGTKYTNQSWLYQNLNINNTTDQPAGYWSLTPYSFTSDNVWCMNYEGYLNYRDVILITSYGIRPVITIFKYQTT